MQFTWAQGRSSRAADPNDPVHVELVRQRDSLGGMEGQRTYPTERQRALKALLLGAVLGVALAVLARGRRSA
jgi:hypothetical protein